MKSFRYLAVFFLSLLFVSSLFAVTDEEIFRAFSLNLSTPGARAVGMGGAFIGRADDATAAETNPAGLTILARPEVSLEYRHSNARNVTTSIFNVPIRNFDLNPHPDVEPGLDRSIADFQALDTLDSADALGFASFVYPTSRVTLAFSRHELIRTDASLFGGLNASPFHFLEPNDFLGNAQIRDVNYNFTAATKIGDAISVGGSIKIADFSFESSIAARQRAEPDFGQHFVSRIDTSETKVGFNAGILVHPTSKVSIGVVYKFEPQFTLGTVVDNTDQTPPFSVQKDVSFDVPDTLGFGISASPNSNWTFNFDVVRVFYSQLAKVDTGFSLFTHLLPNAQQQLLLPGSGNADVIDFKIDDGLDIHLGTEYLWTHESYVFALRGGYYSQSRNRFFLGSAPNLDVDAFLRPIFGSDAGEHFNHITLGTGITYGNFQIDFAADIGDEDEIDANFGQLTVKKEISERSVDIILSSVFRF